MKDKLQGKGEELKGRVTGDDSEKYKGEARQTVGDVKDAGMPPPAGMPPAEKGEDKQSRGGVSETAAGDKPAPQDKPMAGTPPKDRAEKGEARPEPKPQVWCDDGTFVDPPQTCPGTGSPPPPPPDER